MSGRSEAGARFRDAIAAGSVAAVLSGAPSTVHALLTGGDPLEASLAAGGLLLPHEQRRARLLAAAVPVHLALSISWALVLAETLPRRRTIEAAALSGLGIAALDLGVVGCRFGPIGALPRLPQVADHLAYGLTVGIVVHVRRSRRATEHRRSRWAPW